MSSRKTLADSVREHVAACFPGIWIQSHEHDEAEAEITRLCTEQHWQLATWDVDRGLTANGTADQAATALIMRVAHEAKST